MIDKTQHKPDAYNIVGDAVRKFWQCIGHPCDCIAFFDMKYDFDNIWEKCRKLITCTGSGDYETVIFENDFCEGQTVVENLHIVELDEVTDYYWRNRIMEDEYYD